MLSRVVSTLEAREVGHGIPSSRSTQKAELSESQWCTRCGSDAASERQRISAAAAGG